MNFMNNSPFVDSTTADKEVVFVVDDDVTVLQYVRTVLSENSISPRCFLYPDRFLAECQGVSVGCVVIDFSLRHVNGIQVYQQARAQGASIAGILISGRAQIADTVTAMQRGMLTVLEKPMPPQVLQREVMRALDHSRRQLAAQNSAAELRRRWEALSDSEKSVFEFLTAGCSNKAIAQRLDLGLRTVEARRQAILKKLNCTSLADLVRFSLSLEFRNRS